MIEKERKTAGCSALLFFYGKECPGILIVVFVPLIIRRLRKVVQISIITLEVQNGYSNCETRR